MTPLKIVIRELISWETLKSNISLKPMQYPLIKISQRWKRELVTIMFSRSLNLYAQLPSKAKCPDFGMNRHQLSYNLYKSSEGSNEPVQMHRLV